MRKNNAIIADLGLSRVIKSSGAVSKVGTPYYMAK